MRDADGLSTCTDPAPPLPGPSPAGVSLCRMTELDLAVEFVRASATRMSASVAAGIPKARILAAYPVLNEEKIELARIYADANPPRGRPRSVPPKGAEILADRRVPRRGKNG